MKALTPIVAALFAAMLLPGSGMRVSDSAAAQSVQPVRTCQNIQLLIQAQSSQGAAGHIVMIYRMHNLFGQACTLRGYPGVQLLNRNFVTLSTTVVRGPGNDIGSIPVRTVRISGHGNAYFALGYSDVPVGNRPCQVPARYVMIIAPNIYLPVVTYAAPRGGSIYSCTGVINVSPVTAQPRSR